MVSLQKQYKRSGEENAQVQKTEVWIRLRMFRLIRRRMTGTRGFYVQMDLKALEKENPDTVAWLYYPALGINHPVMQDEDNTYYIKHIFSGDKNWIAGDICGCGDIDFFKTNAEGNRKKVSCEIDFVVNKGIKKYYIQSALSLGIAQKEKTELRPLLGAKDCFWKSIVTKSGMKPLIDEEGILHLGPY